MFLRRSNDQKKESKVTSAIRKTLGQTAPVKAMQSSVRNYASRTLANRRADENIAADRRTINDIDSTLSETRRFGGYVSPKVTKQRDIIAKRLSSKRNYY